MKKIITIHSGILIMVLWAFSVQAQKRKTIIAAAKTTDSSVFKPIDKTQKAEADANNYVRMAEDAKVKFKTLFPTNSGDTVYFEIGGITYTDPNLKLLKQKLSAVKNTKGISSSYKKNTAVVKVLYKGGDVSRLYDSLSDEMKELFPAEDMEGKHAILTYKPH